MNRPLIADLLSETALEGARARAGSGLPADPVAFVAGLGVTMWPKLETVIRSVEAHRRTVVASGHGVGKSVTTAGLACWWMEHRGPEAAVLLLAPTWAQVQNVLWRYVRGFGVEQGFRGTVYETAQRGWEVAPRWYMIGRSPKMDSAEALQALQGHHNPNLLVVLDEAPGMSRPLWEVVSGLVTGSDNRVLALGNPLEQAGPFWEACNSETWNYVHISCLEHPNVVSGREEIPGAVSLEMVREQLRDHCARVDSGTLGALEFEGGWWLPSPVFESRVLGQAPEEGTDQLIGLALVRRAQAGDLPGGGETVAGLDPGRYGGDSTSLIFRHGGRVFDPLRRKPHSRTPSHEIVHWAWQECRARGVSRLYIDEIGIGAGVVDEGRRLGLPVIGVGFGKRAQQHRRFANKRAECWWRVREALHAEAPALDLPDDDLLVGDLTAVKYWHDPQGRVVLEPKEQIRKRLGRSPDTGDALAITFADAGSTYLSVDQRRGMAKPERGRWVRQGRKVSRWRRSRGG